MKYSLELEKDVASSVPRVTLSINSGKWISEDIDIYKLIYEEYQRLKEDNRSNNGTIVNTFASIRPAIKSLHMRGYFDGDSTLCRNTKLAMKVYNNNSTEEKRNAVDREMQIFRKAIIIAEGGKTYDSEIFLHESCIYMDVLKELLDKGYYVWQCYDAFYATNPYNQTNEGFEKMVSEIIEIKANNYINKYCNNQRIKSVA